MINMELVTMAFSVSKLHHSYKTLTLRSKTIKFEMLCCIHLVHLPVLSFKRSHSYTHWLAVIYIPRHDQLYS